jgi:hypothetical protein
MKFADVDRFKRKTTATDIVTADTDFVYANQEDVYGRASDYFLGTISREFNVELEPTITTTTAATWDPKETTLSSWVGSTPDVVFSSSDNYLVATHNSLTTTVFKTESFIEAFDIRDNVSSVIAILDKDYLYIAPITFLEFTNLSYNSFQIRRFCRISRKEYKIARFKITGSTTVKIQTEDEQNFQIAIGNTTNDLSTMRNASQTGYLYLTPSTYTQVVTYINTGFESVLDGGRLWVEVRDQRGVAMYNELVTIVLKDSAFATQTWGGANMLDIHNFSGVTDDEILTDAYGISRFDIQYDETTYDFWMDIEVGGMTKRLPIMQNYSTTELE